MDQPAKDEQKSATAVREEEILAFWKTERIFEKTLEKPAPKGEFVFYDGPPFATGLPHHGHLLGSTSKDLFGRYRTMRGYYVRRRWGWDCHGLPIETKVEEKLGIKNKKEIGTIGIRKFNETARTMVLEYAHEWKRYIERLGRWVDFDDSYKTMDASFTESVWWALKKIYNQGRLYEGRKVLMYCPKDETPLAKAEIAMDNTYKDVTDETVTVKFKVKNPEKHGLPANTFILAWTTTPWTLPGNVALAVGPEIEYELFEENGEHFVRAGKGMRGALLVGIEYEPLFDVPKIKETDKKKYTVLPADFVTTEDGTGVVHTAVMYGEDDFKLGEKENLPMVQLLTPGAVFTDDAPELVRGQYYLKANALIIDDLEKRGLLYKKEKYLHSYPHCHRCGTRLIYNAVSSWFINIQEVKAKMLSENGKITWIPAHLKEGRFKNIVEGAPDWTVSRNRYWASPMPVWKDAAGNLTVIGSLEELKQHTKKSGNRYFVMRHGEAEHNIQGIISAGLDDGFHLTEKGKADVTRAAYSLKSASITKIFVSPLTRTVETARIVCAELGLPDSAVVTDERLRDYMNGPLFDRTAEAEWWEKYPDPAVLFEKGPEGGESTGQMYRRLASFMYELEHTWQQENILIVSHGWPIASLHALTVGSDKKHFSDFLTHYKRYAPTSSCAELPFVPLPHNDDYELDYHLPYIDEVALVNEKGEALTRVPEVLDSWVEAGAMPFAEYHYPFENKKEFEKRTPADFISEYIAQTRTWFYYLHALGVLLFDHRAFSNVVTTGTILASDGEKMSKSKKNFTDPYMLMDRYGTDALRYYLMSSVVMQAEDMNFKDEELRDVHNKVVNILRNTLAFYALYEGNAPHPSAASKHVLDRWILARLSNLTEQMTSALDAFDTVRATRPLRDFIEDFSTWYVRRSRDRMRDGDTAALATMRYVLCETAKLAAPIMPFIADEVWRVVRTGDDPESVHLAAWPKKKMKLFDFGRERTLFARMEETRRLCSSALEARQKANIKVRQPLGTLTIDSNLGSEFLALIKDEVNVKEVVRGSFSLDTTLTPELKKEGELRDLLREVQDLRKTAGLSPKDVGVLVVPEDKESLITEHWKALAESANLTAYERGAAFNVRP